MLKAVDVRGWGDAQADAFAGELATFSLDSSHLRLWVGFATDRRIPTHVQIACLDRIVQGLEQGVWAVDDELFLRRAYGALFSCVDREPIRYACAPDQCPAVCPPRASDRACACPFVPGPNDVRPETHQTYVV